MNKLYFDCNATYGPKPFKPLEARWTLDHLIEDLDLCGISGALVQYTQCLHGDPMRANRTLIRDIERHRDRLFSCWIALHGATGEFPDAKSFVREMKDNDVRAVRIESRFFGLPEREAVWGPLRDALLEENALIVMNADRSAPDLVHIENLLGIFRSSNVLLTGHYWNQWREVHYLMETYPKLHIEFSSFQANRAVEYFASRFGADRCLFGTGLMDKAGGAGRGFLDWTLLDDEEANIVAGGNLRRLIGNAGPERSAGAPATNEWRDSLTEAAMNGKPLPCEIWDNHCHILHDGSWAPGAERVFYKGDAEGMMEIIRRVGIDKTAIMSWSGPLSIDTDTGNETVADAVKRYPDHFIGLATINPEHQSPEEIERVIEIYHVGLRFPGLKTLQGRQNINYDDPLFHRWFSFADAHHLYAVIDPAGRLDTELIANLATRYPNMRISLDHCGQSWRYAKWAAEMVNRYPNVDAQLNFTAVTNGTIEYIVQTCGADRVLFGTDTPMRDPRPQAGWLVFTTLTEEQKRLIFGLNFRRILEAVNW